MVVIGNEAWGMRRVGELRVVVVVVVMVVVKYLHFSRYLNDLPKFPLIISFFWLSFSNFFARHLLLLHDTYLCRDDLSRCVFPILFHSILAV